MLDFQHRTIPCSCIHDTFLVLFISCSLSALYLARAGRAGPIHVIVFLIIPVHPIFFLLRGVYATGAVMCKSPFSFWS